VTTQKRSQPHQRGRAMFWVAEEISRIILYEVTGEPMGDHFRPKGQPRRRPGSAWWRCEQMEHEGGPACSVERRWRVLRALREGLISLAASVWLANRKPYSSKCLKWLDDWHVCVSRRDNNYLAMTIHYRRQVPGVKVVHCPVRSECRVVYDIRLTYRNNILTPLEEQPIYPHLLLWQPQVPLGKNVLINYLRLRVNTCSNAPIITPCC